jgi:hypothetical protein
MRTVIALVSIAAVACEAEPPTSRGQEQVRSTPRGPTRCCDPIRATLEARRRELARELETAPARTIRRARQTLITALRDELLPAWDGTPWAMNGTSVVPHQGAIACGYFISTTLLHAGLGVERVRMGQQASLYIAQSLVTTERIWKSSDVPIDKFVARLRRGGDGIYLVGLDNHVGYVIVDGKDTWFHHAGPNAGVQREPALTASFLSTSRYRAAVKLFEDALVEKWLRGTAIPTVLPARRTRPSP